MFFFKTEHDPQPCSEIHGQMTEGIFNIFEDKIFFPIFQNYLYKNQIFSKNHEFLSVYSQWLGYKPFFTFYACPN